MWEILSFSHIANFYTLIFFIEHFIGHIPFLLYLHTSVMHLGYL